jgi:hypothetical protein
VQIELGRMNVRRRNRWVELSVVGFQSTESIGQFRKVCSVRIAEDGFAIVPSPPD